MGNKASIILTLLGNLGILMQFQPSVVLAIYKDTVEVKNDGNSP